MFMGSTQDDVHPSEWKPMIAYVGNGPYCYANATSMLLASIEERAEPSLIEVLTGVGLGAFSVRGANLVVFSNLGTAPDVGTSSALRTLGFEFKERWSETKGAPPYGELRVDLATSPAMLGPLDMGYLVYNPIHRDLAGTDHFVLAYAMDDAEVRLHDPEGFPHAALPLDQLEPAWRAERIGYRQGYYRYWTSPIRVAHPTEDSLFAAAMEFFRKVYRENDRWAEEEGWTTGREAILEVADRARRGNVSPQEAGHLKFFALKLGARRALDYGAFLRHRRPDLGRLKARQAELFGRSHTLAVRGDWRALGESLGALANVEDEFRGTLLAG